MTADPIDRLLKIDPASDLPGCSDGIKAAWAYSPEEWREKGLRIARQLADTGKPFTIGHIQNLGLEDPVVPQAWGSLAASIRSRKIAEVVGWTSHQSKSGQEQGIRIWQSTGMTAP